MKSRNPGPSDSIACMSQIIETLMREWQRKKKGERRGKNPKGKGKDSGLWDASAQVCAGAAVLRKPGIVLMLL